MTEVPEFWWQRKQKEEYEYIYISSVEQEGFTKSDKFYLGRYTATGSNSEATCKSGIANYTRVTITVARTDSQKIGSNWGLMDVLSWSVLQMLYLVEYADYNSQDRLGYGVCNSSQVINTGGCDNLEMKSGCLLNDKEHSVIYRGIENLFGNIRQWLDGVNILDYNAWVCYDRDKYTTGVVTSPYIKLGYADASSSGYIKTIGYDTNNPAIQRPITIGGSDSTYISDYFYVTSSGKVVSVGGHGGQDLYCGLWHYYYNGTGNTGSNIGFRLLFKPE